MSSEHSTQLPLIGHYIIDKHELFASGMWHTIHCIHGQEVNRQKQMNQHEMVDFIGKAHVNRSSMQQCCILPRPARSPAQVIRYLCGRRCIIDRDQFKI